MRPTTRRRLERLRDDLLVIASFLVLVAMAFCLGCSSPTAPAPCDVQAAGPLTPADTVFVGLCVTMWRIP